MLDVHGGGTAVVADDAVLTYRELFAWMTRIAAELADHGVSVGDPVAVACPRGAGAVAALMATVLYGAHYVPLDPEYPRQRLRHMLTDSGAKVVLWSGTRPEDADGVSPIEVPPFATVPGGELATGWLVSHDPDLPVYVIYTSGSTGWPKGVVLQHSVLDNVAHWQAVFSPAPDLRTAQFAPLNFDVSFQEIFGTLCAGGTLHVMPERLRREPVGLVAWLAEHHVQRLFLPYVALQMLAVAASFGEPVDRLDLVEVNVAGEQLVCTDDIRALFEAMPGCRLVNHYGQSESAMVTAHVVDGPPSKWPRLVPIGTPLPGCELLLGDVGDEDRQVGELLVAGAPVALGYHNRAELNAQRYAAVEPTAHGHTRVFRTGDLVRFEDGVVRFLTRIDDDTKLRGIRINLAEVDAQLMAQPEIATAVAVVVGEGNGPKALRAAVVPRDPTAPFDEESVLRRLADTLPEVSIPVSLTVLERVPHAPSGKADRAAVGEIVRARTSE